MFLRIPWFKVYRAWSDAAIQVTGSLFARFIPRFFALAGRCSVTLAEAIPPPPRVLGGMLRTAPRRRHRNQLRSAADPRSRDLAPNSVWE